jgi:hypothetical protein
MKRTVIAVVMAAVGVIGMGRTASSSEEHMTLAGEKLDSGLGSMVYGEKLDSGLADVKPEDWKKYVK